MCMILLHKIRTFIAQLLWTPWKRYWICWIMRATSCVNCRQRVEGPASSSDAGSSQGSATRSEAAPRRTPAQEHRQLFGYQPTRSYQSAGGRRAARNLIRSGKKRGKTRIWSRDLICLADKNETTVPSSGELAKLTSVGLGCKELDFPYQGRSSRSHSVCLSTSCWLWV
jgi:hypothetical protein